MIQDHIGDGKGETTALSFRTAGHGINVLFLQLHKDDSSGEVNSKIYPGYRGNLFVESITNQMFKR